jgi:hypothetical protein
MSSFTVVLPLERQYYFTDRDGVLATVQRSDEIRTLSIDWTDLLADSETVSSVAYTSSGVTTSAPSLATPVSTVTVTGTGELAITATLSTGRKLQRVLRYYEPEDTQQTYSSDYE